MNSVSGSSTVRLAEGSASTMPRDSAQSDRSTTIACSFKAASLSYCSRKQDASSELITISVSQMPQVAPAAALEIENTAATTSAVIFAGLSKSIVNPLMEHLMQVSRPLPPFRPTGE